MNRLILIEIAMAVYPGELKFHCRSTTTAHTHKKRTRPNERGRGGGGGAARFCGRAALKSAVLMCAPPGRCGQAHMTKPKLQHDKPATHAQAKGGAYMQTRRSLDNTAPFIFAPRSVALSSAATTSPEATRIPRGAASTTQLLVWSARSK